MASGLFSNMITAFIKAIHHKHDEPKIQLAETPQAKAPAETETSRREAESDISAQPRSGADSGCDPSEPKCADGSPADAAASSDIPNCDVAAPSSPPVESGNNQPAPIASGAEPAASFPLAMPSSAESGAKTPVAKRNHTKAPAKKAKPKKTPAKQPPNNEPAELSTPE